MTPKERGKLAEQIDQMFEENQEIRRMIQQEPLLRVFGIPDEMVEDFVHQIAHSIEVEEMRRIAELN